jgi:iron complex transport system substrate-binding protein
VRGAAAAAPARVVSVGGATTEIVYALGMESRLVGVDTTSIYPEAAQRLPKIGYQRSLSTEGILSLRPDLVLAGGDAGPPAVIEQLRAARVPVQALKNEHSVQGLRRQIAAVAQALDVIDRGRALDERLAADWRQTEAAVRGYSNRPRVVFVFAHAPNNTVVAGRETAADAMIGLAGAVNAMDAFRGYRPLTAEGIVAAAPDVLLVTTQGVQAAGGAATLLSKPGVAMTPAGRAQRLVELDALYLLGFGPRLPSAVRDLAAALHRPSTAS